LRLEWRQVPDWPKLAWVATFADGAEELVVLHGSHVEIGDGWCVEAVWDGPFECADFDKTEHVFGTGIRCRENRVVFVSAGTMLERLWYCQADNKLFVSNSLPALLACSDVSLRDDYYHYPADMASLTLGLNDYKRTIPASPFDISLVYFRNLEYDGQNLVEVDKPETTPEFTCYKDYHDFLINTAKRLGDNLQSGKRKHNITPLGSVSSGYDSGAAATIAREAGCKEAVTIANASSLFPRSDSGMEIARCLGLECRSYKHHPSAYRYEESIWSAAGMPAGLNLTMFDYPEPLCLFFTGYRGDTVWDNYVLDDAAPLAGPTIAGLSLSEFRLKQGIFHCPVPFWGCLKSQQIQRISLAEEMAPWRLGGGYDRPIPRRILEEATVPRGLFAKRKEVTTVDCFFVWPFSNESMDSFSLYLSKLNLFSPSRLTAFMLRKSAHIVSFLYSNIPKKIRAKIPNPMEVISIKEQSLLFVWSNDVIKSNYKNGIKDIS